MEVHFDSLALGPDRLGCDDAPVPTEGTFADDDHSVHQADIEELAAAAITKGCNPPANTLFCPEQAVTRGQMAAFLTRALNLSAGTAAFTDTTGHLFEPDIRAFATAGITKGCNPPANTLFCPDQPVTRAQMATFLVRAGLTD
ncbi:MAG: S-layer homology domain-containing protein [Acidimicrobiia bacterium]